MIGTKELLVQQNPPAPSIVIPLVSRGKKLNWTLEGIAAGLCCSVESAKRVFADSRILNPLVSIWMSSHGFTAEEDGKSGYFVVSQRTGARYRLRIAREDLVLAPSITLGAGRYFSQKKVQKERAQIHGWAIIFTADLPNAQIWFVAESMADYFKSKGLLNEKWKGKSAAIKQNLEEEQ